LAITRAINDDQATTIMSTGAVMTTAAGPAPYWVSWEELLHSGAHWSGVLRRGTTLRLTDVMGGANVSALFFNFEDLSERYNMPDTLKAQHTAFLTTGCVCYSDMGRILCSVVQDTVGWHDTIGGVSNAALVGKKYGHTRFQEQRNNYHRNGYDSLLNEVAKYGLGRRDLSANINFFSKVTVQDSGALKFHAGHSVPGAFVDLRFEMNTLVVFATCQHPLDPDGAYNPRTVRLTAWQSGPAPKSDVCRSRCPENARGFQNTEMLYR
jgi:urea carboxylase-associated protein 2